MDEKLRVRVGADLAGFERGMNKAVTVARRTAKRLTMAFTGVVTTSALIGAKFEQSLMETATVAQAFGKDLEALENKARELGKTTAYTASTATKSMYALASSGMDITEIVDAVGHAMKLAGATGSQMSQATNLLAASLKQFGLDASESKRVVDTYAGAITKSQLTMERLTEAMKYAGTTGSSLGWSIEQTTAAVAQFANLGLEGSMAGTNLRMAMIHLKKGTDAANEALEKMGLTLADINPETHTFGEILRTLGEHGMTSAQAVEIFGARAGLNMKKLSELAAQGKLDFEGFVEMLKEAQEGVGRASEMYDRMMNTFQGHWKVMLSALQDLAITFFGTFKEEIEGVFDFIVGEVKGFARSIENNREPIKESVREIIGVFEELYGILGDCASTAKTLGEWLAIPDLLDIIRSMGDAYDYTKKKVDEYGDRAVRRLAIVGREEEEHLMALEDFYGGFYNMLAYKERDYYQSVVEEGSKYDEALIQGHEATTVAYEKLMQRRKDATDLALALTETAAEEAKRMDEEIINAYHDMKAALAEQKEFMEYVAAEQEKALEAARTPGRLEQAITESQGKLSQMEYERTQREIENAKKAKEEKIKIAQEAAEGITNTFRMISEAGGRQSEKAFRIYKAFSIIEAMIAAYKSIAKTLADVPFPANVAMSAVIGAQAMAQVALIKSAQPPTYDEGGVSTKPELYYAGVPEAHIPLKEGAVPVKFSGLPPAAIGNSVVNIDMRGSTFLDQATLNATMTTIATHVAASVAPQAVIRSYENDERIRTVIRSRR
ncbi:MAG: phage tail tape measure protein [Deltaproteobacteria bacterium]|nr:MAG: phage tail tape measure protein [Deltaproteobacteria bacterium]